MKIILNKGQHIIFMGPMQAYRVVEFFAGDGNVGKTAKYGMVACAQLDVEYGKNTARVHKQNAFDLLEPSGLAFLGSLQYVLLLFFNCLCVFFSMVFKPWQVGCVGPSQR